MNPIPKKYADFITESLKYIPSFDGLDILEVGVGEIDDSLSTAIYSSFKPKSIVAVDPKFELVQVAPNFKIVNEDMRETSFKDGQFDCIVSIAVFEHIRVFDLALEEMYRVLKPGGKVFSIFGPIYSSPVGHHLWLTINKKLYKFPDLDIGAYAHLLYDEAGFADHLVKKGIANQKHAKILADYVYHTSEQNRCLFNDYEKFVKNSKFKINYFAGTKAFPRYESLLGPEPKQVHEKLRSKFPNVPESTFDWNSVIVCLEK